MKADNHDMPKEPMKCKAKVHHLAIEMEPNCGLQAIDKKGYDRKRTS